MPSNFQILPEAVAAESPHVPYHPGSPWGDGLISSNTTVGDMHQWNGRSRLYLDNGA